MKLSKLLIALVVIAVLASNGFQIYQNNQSKTKIDKLQTNVISLQKQVKSVDTSVSNVDNDIQTTDTDLKDFCGNFATFTCP